MIRVFENESFIVLDKPAGVLTTPSRYEDQDPRRCLGLELQEQLGIQVYPVHRLDFEVSGLVLFAKDAESHKVANAWFEKRTVSKTYRALTHRQGFDHIPAHIKNPRQKMDLQENEELIWKCRLLKGKKRAYEHPEGKECETRAIYKGLEKDFLLWDLMPVTGRSHQLRFDLSRNGFPIVGDDLYGSSLDVKKDEIALRSYKLDFSEIPSTQRRGLPDFVTISPLLAF